MFNIPNKAIQKHVLFYSSLERLSTGTIYNSSCAKLLYSQDQIDFVCLEQLFSNTGQSWQNERPMCSFNKKANEIKLNITEVNGKNFWYIFKDWQLKALIKSCQFCIDEGTTLTGQLKLKD